MFDDLREFIDKAQGLGECKIIEGAHWDVEIGRIAELSLSIPDSPLLIFDNIEGYPRGYRVAANPFTSSKRVALALGLPPELTGIDQVRVWRDKLSGIKPLPPVEVKVGPVKENVMVGKDIDLFKFP